MIRLAFDIGGTFTDFVLHDASGAAHLLKVPSTRSDPGEAVVAGLERLLGEAGVALPAIDTVLHATTVATNAVLERRGAATGLITTEGFRDVLIIGRQKRYETYDLYIDKPKPLVERRHIVEVRERVGADGAIVRELDETSLDAAVDAMLAEGRESVAVVLMHSYANPEHERRIGAALARRAPGMYVSLSSDVSPRYREYERTSTTVANAYVQPIVERYVAGLESALHERGYRHDLFVMQSNGGLVSPGLVRAQPIRIVESGPAAGVLMGGIVGRSEGCEHVITFDMGGTTAKLGAVDHGRPAVMPTFEVDLVRHRKGSGLPINVPAVELLEIGAGGGSIARVDNGMIAVGPRSAGAEPGPICYGAGGTEPTVTDANLVLGYLDPEWFNAGGMRLDTAGAAEGIARCVGAPLGLETGEAAWGVHLLATKNMENAMRIVSVERGRDPRAYAMVAFGGAGPLHAARIARSIGIPTVIVPWGAGVGSAIGLLEAAPRIDVATTRVMHLGPGSGAGIAEVYAELENRARADLARLGAAGALRWSRYAQMRYVGQGFEVLVDLPDGDIGPDYGAQAARAFIEAYRRRHDFVDPQGTVEAVDWGLVATLDGDGGARPIPRDPRAARSARGTTRPAWFPETGGYVETRIADRGAMRENATIAGPAIIEDPDCTTVVLPGDVARVSEAGHLIIEIASGEGA